MSLTYNPVTRLVSFIFNLVTMFVDSIFKDNETIKRTYKTSSGSSTGTANYAQRNGSSYRNNPARQRGANVRTMGEMKAVDAACGPKG